MIIATSRAVESTPSRRPRTRGECLRAPRPCFHVHCRYHLFTEAVAQGRRVDLASVPETCALDVASRGGATLDEIGAVLRISKERARQVELMALRKLHATARLRELGELALELGAERLSR